MELLAMRSLLHSFDDGHSILVLDITLVLFGRFHSINVGGFDIFDTSFPVLEGLVIEIAILVGEVLLLDTVSNDRSVLFLHRQVGDI